MHTVPGSLQALCHTLYYAGPACAQYIHKIFILQL